MSKIINQFKRIWSDTGSKDKDFSDQELKLKIANDHLAKATDNLSRASRILTDYLNSNN